MKAFRGDNTESYSPSQIEKLNSEWLKKAEDMNLEYDSEEYQIQLKSFCDEVSRR